MNLKDIKALVFQRGWMTLSGAATILIVPQTLTQSEQGLFFTFLSLAAIQSIFEAGITTVFFNYAAHERAQLTSIPPVSEPVRIRAEERLLDLVRMARRWFLGLASLFCLIVGTFGYYFVETAVLSEGLTLQWKIPFVVLIGAISLSLYNLSRIPILEGHGLIADVANFRLRASVLSMAVLWAGMLAGWGLWALAVSYLIQSITMTAQISSTYRKLRLYRTAAQRSASTNTIDWRTEILPLQFRLAGSYFCGYFIAQAVVPYTLHVHGSATAGQVGLMLSVFNALATIVASYIYATGPQYATFIALHNFEPLARTFYKVTVVTVGAAFCVYTMVLLGMYILQLYDLEMGSRIVSLEVALWMVIIGLINAYIGSAATLLRAQKKEPMLKISIAAAIGYVLAMAALQNTTIEHLYAAFMAVQLCIALPLTIMAIKKSGLIRSFSPTI